MEFDDRALVVDGTLVLADLHVGKEAASVELPVGERADILGRLEGLLARHEPAAVVLAGDVLDAFGSVPQAATATLHDLERTVREAGARPVVTPGNHDAMLSGVWDGATAPEHVLEGADTVVCHGHEPPTTAAGRYVVGHDHPTVAIEGRKRACYLVGEQTVDGRAAEVVMLPAFNRLVAGVRVGNVRAGGFQSPLVTDPDALRPVVWDRQAAEALSFPPLGECRGML